MQTLDSMLERTFTDSAFQVPVMKLDAQGFEVHILRGAKKTLSSGAIKSIKFELATDWLKGQGTSAFEFMSELAHHGYVFHGKWHSGGPELTPAQVKHLTCQFGGDKLCPSFVTCQFVGVTDLVAVHANRGRLELLPC